MNEIRGKKYLITILDDCLSLWKSEKNMCESSTHYLGVSDFR